VAQEAPQSGNKVFAAGASEMKQPVDLNGRTLCGDMDFCVPLLPPSVNHYVKHTRLGKHYVTEEAKRFMQTVAALSNRQCVRYERYFVEIYLNLGPKERMDVDNCAKVILDALAKCGIIHSDAAVTDLALHKRRAPESSTCITIWQPAHDVVQQARKANP
jgi:Holliday junction resolvase RusA-like endonuclease